MNLAIEKLPECRAKVSAEFSKESVEKTRDGVVSAFMDQAKLPGFRPGKLPRPVVEKKFKKGIEDELKERLTRQVFSEVTENEKLQILGIAKVERAAFETDGTFSYISEVVTKPEVDLTEDDYKGISVEVEKKEVTDEMVEEFLKRVQLNFAVYEDADEDKEAEPGDKVVVTFSATTDGGEPLGDTLKEELKPLAERDEEFEVDIPSENQNQNFEMIPGLAEGLVGVKTGETREVDVQFGEKHFVPELVDVSANYSVKICAVKKAVLPEINDALAEKIGLSSLEELRTQFRLETETKHSQERVDAIDQQILVHLNTEHEFDLPKEQIFQETQYQVNSMVSNALQQGLQSEDIDEHEKEILDSAGQRAVTNLRTRYLLEKITEKEGIKVSDEELKQEILVMAQQQKKPPQKLVRELQETQELENIRTNISISKAIAFLRENASVTEVDPVPEKEDES